MLSCADRFRYVFDRARLRVAELEREQAPAIQHRERGQSRARSAPITSIVTQLRTGPCSRQRIPPPRQARSKPAMRRMPSFRDGRPPPLLPSLQR